MITVFLYYDDVPRGLAWLTHTLGARELTRRATSGLMTYAEVELAGLPLVLTDRTDPAAGGTPARFQFTLDGVEPLYQRALAAGAQVVATLAVDPTGRPAFTVADPGGYHWTFVGSASTDDESSPAADDEIGSLTADGTSPIDRLGRLTDLATPFAVRVLATLRVPDLIEQGVTDLVDLATACAANRDALGRLLRYLAHRGVLTEANPDVFALTEVGRLLCERGAAGQRGWLDLDGLGARMDLAYPGLLHSVRTGEPAYATVHGRTFWAELDAHPGHRRYFDELMMSQQHLTAPQVAELYDWCDVAHVYDVGGGSGALLTQLLSSHPHLRGTLVDRPGAARAAGERIAASGLADRADTVAGDFFGALPTGGDVYVVSRALTDWNDRDATTILRRCAEAAGDRGRVLIVEVLPTEPFMPHLSPFDLQMLVVVGGRERGLTDFESIAGRAGLAVAQVLRGRDGLTLIECVRADRSPVAVDAAVEADSCVSS
ncbi:hypothetical protein GCM10027280_18680 [Micromonospora polyrhachis]|uniref:Putative glyoxalase superfamily protein PhnB/precorrin-6B methylase 2 n=1 Tax=Micromonospora polyrhachis TaxID=1282883 RepID=A0A7W7SLF8_9ACTN|nr:methyltransferase [Micromonospora polyrhachis]MBB4956963.1 putative glyoxalase superfamily protein PhnB/precorrin-6B methylase 2 [Micromonospora polyrhachis]